MDAFEKSEMAKKPRSLAAKTRYELYDWLISHISESVEKSVSDAKEKILKLFEKEIDNNITKDWKPKKTAGTFNDKYIECKSRGDEKLSIEQYLKKIKLTMKLTSCNQKIIIKNDVCILKVISDYDW